MFFVFVRLILEFQVSQQNKTEEGDVEVLDDALEESATSTTALLLLLGVLGSKSIDLTDEVIEDLLNVVLSLGRGLNEAAVEALGERLTLLRSDDTLVSQIALVSDQDHGDLIGILDTQDLIAELGKIVEGRLSDDGVDEDKTLAVLHVEVAHGSKLFLWYSKPKSVWLAFFLLPNRQNKFFPTNWWTNVEWVATYSTGGIQDLEHVAVIVDLDELTVRILDGGIILKMWTISQRGAEQRVSIRKASGPKRSYGAF